jgi:hypothetical protein
MSRLEKSLIQSLAAINGPRTYTVLMTKFCEFPIDMLRYDSAEPAAPEDAALIERLNDQENDKTDLDRFVVINLKSDWRNAPNVARWESFNCKITECSDPTVQLSKMKRGDDQLEPDELRQKTVKRIADAVVRMRGRLLATELVYEALREAADVAGERRQYRQRAIGVCAGVALALADKTVFSQSNDTRMMVLRGLVELTRDLLDSEGDETRRFCLLVEKLVEGLEQAAEQVPA